MVYKCLPHKLLLPHFLYLLLTIAPFITIMKMIYIQVKQSKIKNYFKKSLVRIKRKNISMNIRHDMDNNFQKMVIRSTFIK